MITLARAMLDDYDTLEYFWAEAINTACHASNRVYLHRLLGKTPYELLIGRKPNISYFRVFRCKCFIYKKKRLGKFEKHCDVGFFVGYASNSKAYRVFNQTTGMVEEMCDVEFGETNGSQEEVFVYDDVDDEPLRSAMKNMTIGDIKPKEVHEDHGQGGGTLHQDLAPPWHHMWMRREKRKKRKCRTIKDHKLKLIMMSHHQPWHQEDH